MAHTLQAIRGMNDILPTDTPLWAGIETIMRNLLNRYGYQEMRVPLLESTELFKRSIGEVTDIVEKEMYTFNDRNGDSLTLRPEATAGFVRAGIQHGLLHNQTQRLWCMGPMFRYEKPQKGRSRQFHQLNVEAFGLTGPDIDAEMIGLTARLWRELGLTGVHLQLNSLGSAESRSAYRDHLIHYFEKHYEQLDADSRNRLYRNPLRILDSKNPQMAELIAAAPLLIDHIDAASASHFEDLRARLDQVGIPYTLNPRLVRGLDYYNRTVFEWVGDHLGAQNTFCGGGRYDGLVAHLGGRSTPGIGFAIGLERLVLIAAASGLDKLSAHSPQAYLIMVGSRAEQQGMALAERLRDQLPRLRLTINCGGGSLKNQFKRADRSGAHYALVLGDDELASGKIGVKPLRHTEPQHALAEAALVDLLRQIST